LLFATTSGESRPTSSRNAGTGVRSRGAQRLIHHHAQPPTMRPVLYFGPSVPVCWRRIPAQLELTGEGRNAKFHDCRHQPESVVNHASSTPALLQDHAYSDLGMASRHQSHDYYWAAVLRTCMAYFKVIPQSDSLTGE
jgi:hypothetical protein